MTTETRIDTDTERAVRAFADRASREHAVAGIILFGSRARRRFRSDSDADVAVLLRGPRGQFLDTKLALADIAYDVLLDTDVLIQPLPIWEEEWKHPEYHANPALLQNIVCEGIRL